MTINSQGLSLIFSIRKLFFLMEEERKKLEKIYQALNEEDTDKKKWNQALK